MERQVEGANRSRKVGSRGFKFPSCSIAMINASHVLSL